jgi:spectinomycin phosphotransferase
MLEKPNLLDEEILFQVQTQYGLQVAGLTFLPLGADQNTAVYRVEIGVAAYFLKLRRGAFDELSVTIPRFLKSLGLQNLLSPLETRFGRLWGDLDEYRMFLYPFIAGEDGYAVGLSEAQWRAFGAALRGVHAAQLPAELFQRLPREAWASYWRERVRRFQVQAEATSFADPTAIKLAAFLREKRAEISHLVDRADQLALALRARPLEFVLCHADVHPGNLLIAGDAFYLVDWDQPILAPKERDLLLLGGCVSWNDPRALDRFYQGYGPVDVDKQALAYYRYERVIEDLAVECELILGSEAGGADREREYGYFVSNFLPGQTLELARRADES